MYSLEPRPQRCRERGSTLLELITGLAAGMLVVLAALATLALLQGSATAQGDAARLQQKLDVALHILGGQLRQAGARELRTLPGRGTVSFSQAFDGYAGSGDAVSGDDGSRGGPDVLRISYQDHPSARDCLGNRPGAALAGVRVDSRFSVSAGQLRCLGANPGTGAQSLIDGVEDFQVRYGLAERTAGTMRWQQLDAADVQGRWAQVRTVQVCLQISGDSRHQAARSGPLPTGCNGSPIPADGRLRRVVRATFHLRNAAS